MCMNKEKCADACWVRHLAHLGGEEGGAEPRLAGAQHCAAAGVWSLKYRGFCKSLLLLYLRIYISKKSIFNNFEN